MIVECVKFCKNCIFCIIEVFMINKIIVYYYYYCSCSCSCSYDDDADVLVHAVRKDKDDDLMGKLEELKVSLPVRTQGAIDLACERGASRLAYCNSTEIHEL